MSRRKGALTVADRDAIENPSSFRQEKRTPSSILLSSSKRVFILCLAMHMLNSLLVQTYFNPDEHWQALEVAHRITFGYGHLTWEWKKGIRSYLHPMLFGLLYKVLEVLRLDTQLFMMKAPRMLQSVLSAFGDVYTFHSGWYPILCFQALVKLFAQITNWFMFYCITRTLSNSLETVLTLVGLYYWPCMRVSSSKAPLVSRKWGLAAAALACAIRPTSAITWVYVGLLELFVTRDRLNHFPGGGPYWGLGAWTHVFVGSFDGFSVMLFTFLPFSISGIIFSKQWKLSGLIAWVLGLYSVLGHKEFRFVLPVLPVALMFSGYSLAIISRHDFSNRKRKRYARNCVKCFSKSQLAIFFLLVTNLPMAFYMSMVHQRGAEDVMYYLSREAITGKVKNVLFLTPCHATPYHSTLHQNLPMRFLECSPSETRGIRDESVRFMMDPAGFASEFAKNWSLPSHIVLFDSQEKRLKDILEKRFFHAHFKVDRDLQASVVVYALRKTIDST